MSDYGKQGRQEIERRRRRIRKMKTAIICFFLLLVIIPLVICVMSQQKIKKLEKTVEELNEMLDSQAYEKYEEELLAEEEKPDQPDENAGKGEKGDEEEKEDNTGETDGKDEEEPEQTDDTEDGNCVYLTFDDGPSENTNAILDILQEYDIKATFFVIKKDGEAAIDAYNRIVDDGHTLAMHSYTHQYNVIYKNLDSFKKDVTDIQDYLYDITGVRSTYYRFPGGSSNSISKVSIQKCIKWLNSQGIDYYDWNSMTGDASGQKYSVKKLIENAMEDVRKYKTSVVLMHDANDKDTTVEALPKLIKQLQKEGYKILPIDKNTPLVQHVKYGG